MNVKDVKAKSVIGENNWNLINQCLKIRRIEGRIEFCKKNGLNVVEDFMSNSWHRVGDVFSEDYYDEEADEEYEGTFVSISSAGNPYDEVLSWEPWDNQYYSNVVMV